MLAEILKQHRPDTFPHAGDDDVPYPGDWRRVHFSAASMLLLLKFPIFRKCHSFQNCHNPKIGEEVSSLYDRKI